MYNLTPTKNLVCVFLFILHCCYALNIQFMCPKKSDKDFPMPHMPSSYSSNIMLNYLTERRTVQVRHAVKGINEMIELISAKRRVKYIHRQDLKTLLRIDYKDEQQPSCSVEPSPGANAFFLREEDSGPKNILKTFFQKVSSGWDDFRYLPVHFEDGIVMYKWEGCFDNINISLSFGPPEWTTYQTSALVKVGQVIQKAEAELADEETMSAHFSMFDPRKPADSEFQPPENVYCEGWRKDVPIPPFSDQFSYDSEILVYESPEGIRPYVSQRKVFYDYAGNISRTDFYDYLTDSSDTFANIRAVTKTVIHDFGTGVQYSFNPATGKCTIDEFKTTFSVITVKLSELKEMPNAKKYFFLSPDKMSYTGQFSTRGLNVDVFTCETSVDGLPYSGSSIVSFYFTTNKTQVVEGGKVEENVLLRMVIRPKTGIGMENMVVVNFYNFVKSELDEYKYDLSSCYNESYSKNLVFTFPEDESLKGYEKLTREFIQKSLAEATGIGRHRIFVKEITFKGSYMYVEFRMIDKPPIQTTQTESIVSLEDAYSKLRTAVADGTFNVTVKTPTNVIVLRPEPQGLNEFSGERHQKGDSGYKEGSVIGLTIGMLVLGFLLGGMTINLVVSKKFGVSLFQPRSYGDRPFDNPLGESSM